MELDCRKLSISSIRGQAGFSATRASAACSAESRVQAVRLCPFAARMTNRSPKELINLWLTTEYGVLRINIGNGTRRLFYGGRWQFFQSCHVLSWSAVLVATCSLRHRQHFSSLADRSRKRGQWVSSRIVLLMSYQLLGDSTISGPLYSLGIITSPPVPQYTRRITGSWCGD